ncbi:MAG: DUF86 domain-containing protein [Selenomonadaceae bacterium]|nr:DUF86 domain-containing protein [Selenomonadaceae bacterium]MBR6887202.1 DUF86 domain-containing protein [Selenomonadaceae bacterium]
MRGRQADLQRLFHIVKWCRKLQIIGSDVQTYENFISRKNYQLVDVSAFYIGQIGEHVRNLSDENDMRNILIHNYGKIKKEVVWSVITEHAPILAEKCLEVLRAENRNVDAELREELAEETDIFDGEQTNDNR